MTISRRSLLVGTAALALSPDDRAEAFLPRGIPPISTGWKTLPVGAGGLITGMYIAPNGTMVCRSDVGGMYRWTGTSALASLTDPNAKWLQLMNNASIPTSPGGVGGSTGAYEHVLAPSNTDKHYAIMGSSANYWVNYSTNQGQNWSHSNLTFTNADSNGNERRQSYKIIVDPVNENVVYVGLPNSNGLTNGVYTTLGAAAGGTTDGHTFAAIAALGQCTFGCCAGLVFDSSQGTTTVLGQLVTKRIIIPVGGVGIFESTNGGVSFTEIAVSSIGSFASNQVWNATINRNGVYYANVLAGTSPSAVGNLWRYASGVWTNLSTSMGTASNTTSTVFIDPRVGHEGFLGVPTNGLGIGQSSSNADIGSPPTWTSTSFGNVTVAKAASYDIPYLNFIFGQGTTVFVDNATTVIDGNGTQFWCGGQSIWYLDNIITYPTFGGQTITSNSFGRGQEATVAQDVLFPPGGSYAICGPQDLGLPLRGSFTSYPVETFPHNVEYIVMSLEYAASAPNIVVARVTAQDHIGDSSGISTDYGATFTTFPTQPNWQAVMVGSASGTILTVTGVTSGIVAIGQWVNSDSTVTIASFGTGTGGVGTYNLSNPVTIAGGSSIDLVMPVQGGNAVAVDANHIMMVGTGFGPTSVMIPQYTTDGGATWQRNNLPPKHWPLRSWFFGGTPRPFAVGYGADLGTVWAVDCNNNQASLYKSIDSGATFGGNSPSFNNGLPLWASAPNAFTALNLPYLNTVPGFPGHLWLVGSHSGGNVLFQVSKDGGATWSGAGSFPSISGQTLFWPDIFTFGAPASPGGYPTIYCRFSAFGLSGFYEGQYNGTTITWTLFGPTGNLNADLPVSCQVSGVNAVRGDFNLYHRVYAVTGSMGFAYYHP